MLRSRPVAVVNRSGCRQTPTNRFHILVVSIDRISEVLTAEQHVTPKNPVIVASAWLSASLKRTQFSRLYILAVQV